MVYTVRSYRQHAKRVQVKARYTFVGPNNRMIMTGDSVGYDLPVTRSHYRVDSVIESSLQEVRGRKHYAIINLSLHFTEVIIKASFKKYVQDCTYFSSNVIPENLVAVH